MAQYLLKFKGRYRILPELDLGTNDFPRDKNGEISKEYDDIYIACQYGNRIYNYGKGILYAYIPSIGRGRNIRKALDKQGILYTDYNETDEEVEFKFKAKDIEPIATLLKAKTNGANISPFSKKNLPKAKDVEIPLDEIERYKVISSGVKKGDLLILHRLTNTFLDTILQRTIRKSTSDFDYKTDMKSLCMARQIKEYIYFKGMWDKYLQYMETEIKKIYKKQ